MLLASHFVKKLDTIWDQNEKFCFSILMFGIVNFGILNVLSKFESQLLGYKKDTEFDILRFVNKA